MTLCGPDGERSVYTVIVTAQHGAFSAAIQPQRSLLKARRVVQGLASYRDFLDMLCATSVAVKVCMQPVPHCAAL